ncbi:MAG: 6-hydroxy-3-succinoylpyridine 3-monooxygenase HspA [Candidatus Accumulibacter adjunctus]|uniref:6-hydroxy-3-succinoylpyridine 3-monooxygenase HspA n=1 Tax=Candidatus Accumulibacter adjunctus TaxID=1454001 RepID=A0A011PHW2_9PROT|nr:MAG: 6-hydroxy-3-succinoylpyridine 3-monooxygenase HspA [Candidatus Accumulibacter adjunctus]
MTRVISYIDGFNLYFGLRSKGWRKYYWLDLVALSTSLLKPGQELQAVHYFTTRIRNNRHNSQDIQRQNMYLEALGMRPALSLHFGHYLEKPKQCRKCGATWMDFEEKMTDVNIAVQLLADAFDDRFDTALLVSADSVLTSPVRQVRNRFPLKRIVVAQPPGRHSSELTKAATGFVTVGEDKLRQSQLPPLVARSDGFVLQRPTYWT